MHIKTDKKPKTENAAEQWVRLCLMHIENKKRLKKENKNGKQK